MYILLGTRRRAVGTFSNRSCWRPGVRQVSSASAGCGRAHRGRVDDDYDRFIFLSYRPPGAPLVASLCLARRKLVESRTSIGRSVQSADCQRPRTPHSHHSSQKHCRAGDLVPPRWLWRQSPYAGGCLLPTSIDSHAKLHMHLPTHSSCFCCFGTSHQSHRLMKSLTLPLFVCRSAARLAVSA